MDIIVGLLFTILGFVPLIIMSIREKNNKKMYWKTMIGASCGAFVMGGIIILTLAMI